MAIGTEKESFCAITKYKHVFKGRIFVRKYRNLFFHRISKSSLYALKFCFASLVAHADDVCMAYNNRFLINYPFPNITLHKDKIIITFNNISATYSES